MDKFNKHFNLKNAVKDRNKVFSILEANEDKDFVRRILYPGGWVDEHGIRREVAPAIINANNDDETHRMGIASGDGKHWVYPNIMRDDMGILKNYADPDDRFASYREARRRGEAIPFDTHEEAEWFEKRWKLMWNLRHKADY